MAHSLLISMGDIAALAGVQRPVISTWRRRHPDFPAPVSGGKDRALFDSGEVCEWLVATERADRRKIEPDLHLYGLTQLHVPLSAHDLVAALTALVALRALDDEPLVDGRPDLEGLADRAAEADPADLMLTSEIAGLPDELSWLAGTADDLVEAAWECRRAFERIMNSRARLGAADLGASMVDSQVATLMAGLAGAADQARQHAAVVVADPAAGPGDLLTEVIGAIGEHAAPVVVAAEPDRYLARLSRRRLAAFGVPLADQYVSVADGFGDDGPDPDVIVTQLPYQPSETRSPADLLTRVDEIGLRLADDRSAAVLGPASVLTDPLDPANDRERVRLLAGGAVEAIISLPGGVVPFRPGYQTAIWVLTQAHRSRLRGRVLLADLSNRPLSPEVVDGVVADVVTWRRGGYRAGAHSLRYCAVAEVGRLVTRSGPLTARPAPTERELVTVVPATVTRVNELERALGQLADPATAREAIRTGVARAGDSRPDTASIGALARAGRLSVISGTRLAAEHVTTEGHHHVWGAAEVTGRARIGGRTVDRAVLAEHYPRAVFTEPGDVLVTTTPDKAVRFDGAGFGVVEFGARALRVPESERRRLPPRVLAALLAANCHDGRRAAGAVRASRRLADWQVPLLDPDTADRFDRLLAAMDQRRSLAHDELDALDELVWITAAGLTDGTLTLQPEQERHATP